MSSFDGSRQELCGRVSAWEYSARQAQECSAKKANERLRPMPGPTLEQAAGGEKSRTTRGRSGARPTVLLVEDEDAVRRVAGEILSGAGYVVLEAKNGREALSLLERRRGTVDVLVADVVMPAMSGPELAQQLGRRYQGMATIFISGYPEHHIFTQGTARVNAFYLYKPFSVEALTKTVERALAAK